MPITAPGIPETLLIDSRGGVYRHNIETNDTTLLHDFRQIWTDIAVTPNGDVYAVTNTGLYSLNMFQGTATFLRSLGSAANGLASDAEGNLYIGYGFTNRIDVARTDGTISGSISLPTNVSSAGDIHIIGPTLYYTTRGRELLTIDLNTNAVIDSVEHGLSAAYGLHHNGGELFVMSGDDIYTIDPDTGETVLVHELGRTFVGTVYGAATSPSTTINGSGANDVLVARFGDLSLFGRAGNDVLAGSVGADNLNGNQGNDVLYSGLGDDRLSGDQGRDTLYGGGGNDTMFGGSGNDLIGAGAGDDELFGGDGNDSMWLSLGNDSAFGGIGNDTMGGGAGRDTIAGGAGDDVVYGGFDDDIIYAGAGDDQIFAGPGNDTVYGGAGNDALTGGPGSDLFFGGTGDDTVFGGNGDDTISGQGGDDLIYGGGGADTFVFGLGGGDDSIVASLDDDALRLDDSLWTGTLTETQVLSAFGAVSGDDYVLSFADGDSVTLLGAQSASLTDLLDLIEVF